MHDLKVLVLGALLLGAVTAMYAQPVKAQVSLEYGIGGIFAPGAIDIFTPSLICGSLVTLVGPNGGVFVWAPTRIYDWFALATVTNPPPSPHAGLWALGTAMPNLALPYCPPILTSVGTGLTPGF